MNTLRIAQLQPSCKQKSYVLFCPGNKRNIYQAQETAAAAQTASPLRLMNFMMNLTAAAAQTASPLRLMNFMMNFIWRYLFSLYHTMDS